MRKFAVILIAVVILVFSLFIMTSCAQKTVSQQNQEVESDWTVESWE